MCWPWFSGSRLQAICAKRPFHRTKELAEVGLLGGSTVSGRPSNWTKCVSNCPVCDDVFPMISHFKMIFPLKTSIYGFWWRQRLGRSRSEGTDLGQQPISTAGEADVPGRWTPPCHAGFIFPSLQIKIEAAMSWVGRLGNSPTWRLFVHTWTRNCNSPEPWLEDVGSISHGGRVS